MHRARLLAFLLAMAASIGLAYWLYQREQTLTPAPETEEHRQIRKSVQHNVSAEIVAEVLRIEAQEKHIAETVWAKEMLAQECGRTIEALWDAINASSNKLDVVADFPLGEVLLGQWNRAQEYPHGIRVYNSSGAGELLALDAWRALIARVRSEGWALEQIEFRHNRFDPDAQGQPSRSRFYFSAHLVNTSLNDRATLEGDLDLDWGAKRDDGSYEVSKVDASRIAMKTRRGDPPFKLVRDDEIIPQGQSKRIDPLILYDLDGDGRSEIILAARNLVYRHRGNSQFSPEPLCRFPEEFIGTALIADLDTDGVADFLCAKWEGLFLFKGSSSGKFESKAQLVWKAEPPLEKPMVITCGDIDADGDLDLFLDEYKDPYEGGVTPRPFFDANDGYPAHLLVNDGAGRFADRTIEAGLGSKRTRRTFSASFVDLDRDSDLDLLVVSDFAGVDLFRNDGRGQFTDLTSSWLDERHGFGMAHSFADFNHDGLLDFLMIGMTSPTLERLNHLGLTRSPDPHERAMELRMTSGNRLYLAKASGGFEQTTMSDAITRSGWAWGCSSFDFDNDGFVDVYIGNGFQSQGTVTDSEGEYWLHDRFLESTSGATATDLYFKSSGARTRGTARSFGGNERNRFYWNRGGTNFLEIAYLFGLSFAEDSRNVVADDLDRDGRVDLIIITSEVWPKEKQTLKVLQNHCEAVGNWIGLSPAYARSPGQVVQLQTGSKKSVAVYATGHGFRSQSAPSLHFGLGRQSALENMRIITSSNVAHEIPSPELNKYISLPAPK